MLNALAWMVPLALGMGFIGLMAFLWSLNSGQLEDLEGAAVRVLLDKEDRPIKPQPGATKKLVETSAIHGQIEASDAHEDASKQKAGFKENSDGKHH